MLLQTHEDWLRIRESVDTFSPLIDLIFHKHPIPFHEPTPTNKATNAVFKVGSFIIKIFPPIEADLNSERDFLTELHCLSQFLSIPCPKLFASGTISYRHEVHYLVMEFLDGAFFP
jgi:aminoglycoside phosphotransferase (APT) family kinase protein